MSDEDEQTPTSSPSDNAPEDTPPPAPSWPESPLIKEGDDKREAK